MHGNTKLKFNGSTFGASRGFPYELNVRPDVTRLNSRYSLLRIALEIYYGKTLNSYHLAITLSLITLSGAPNIAV